MADATRTVLLGVALVLLLLLLTARLTTASCPDNGCVCANNLIVCSCSEVIGPNGTSERALTLASFESIDYIAKVIIHSCDRLVIPKDTFAGLSISDELRIIGVRHIDIEPWAFREMQRSPKQIIIRDSGLSVLRADTFAGISNVEHLWLRNVTVDSIESYAFRHMSNIDYLYFRESKVNHIKTKAFSKMSNIRRLFLRGRMGIQSIGPFAFSDSSIDEVIIEDATILTMNGFALSGMTVRQAQIVNCSVLASDMDIPADAEFPVQTAEHLHFFQTNFDRFSLSPFSNYSRIHLEHCRIEELIPAGQVHLRNVSIIKVKTTLINYMRSYCLAGAKDIKEILVQDSAIDTIFERAFEGAERLGVLAISETRMIQFNQHAFSNATFDEVIFDRCAMKALAHNCFGGLSAKRLELTGMKLDKVHGRAFKGAKVDQIVLHDCHFKVFEDHAFESAHASQSINVTECVFEETPTSSTLAGAITPRLEFSQNRFPCSCMPHNAQFFAMADESANTQAQHWTFRRNLCAHNATAQPPTTIEHFRKACPASAMRVPTFSSKSLTCRHFAQVLECICKDPMGANPVFDAEILAQVNVDISTVSIGDCDQLTIASGTVSPLTTVLHRLVAVTIYRVKRLFIEPKAFDGLHSLMAVLIVNSDLSTIPTAAFNRLTALKRLRISNCRIDSCANGAISHCSIERLTIHETEVRLFLPKAFRDSKIANMTWSNCVVKEIFDDALDEAQIGFLTVVGSTIVQPRPTAFTLSKKVCFKENKMPCECGAGRLRKLQEMNACVEDNFCSAPNSVQSLTFEKALRSEFQTQLNACTSPPPSMPSHTATAHNDAALCRRHDLLLLVLLFASVISRLLSPRCS
uniref:Uncharacterized protein n=1 Tax=Plectus sambesii TaxID=2011161 RepID=A0A914VXV6_9BILA